MFQSLFLTLALLLSSCPSAINMFGGAPPLRTPPAPFTLPGLVRWISPPIPLPARYVLFTVSPKPIQAAVAMSSLL